MPMGIIPPIGIGMGIIMGIPPIGIPPIGMPLAIPGIDIGMDMGIALIGVIGAPPARGVRGGR